LGIVFIMVTKLPFSQCVITLVTGLVVGLLFSVPVFVRKPT